MKTKNILLALGVLIVFVFGIAQIPTILPASPVTEFVDFLKGLKSTGPLEVGPLGRSLKVWWNFEDFIRGSSAAQYNMGIWTADVSGTGAAVTDDSGTTLRPGIFKLVTGTTTAGRAGLNTWWETAKQFLFGAGVYTIEADINIATLSTVTEAYTLRFGFADSTAGTPGNGCYFEYSNVGSTPNWYKVAASVSTWTSTDTTIAAATGWTRLKIVVNAAGTSAEYFINGTSVGVVTTNIPVISGCSGLYNIIKSAGTTSRLFYVDWAWLHVDLTTSR